MLRSALMLVAVLVLLLVESTARANAEPTRGKLKAVLHVQSELERALLERVRGQLSDVPVELIVVDEATPSRELAWRARHAQTLAAAHGADVVLWFVIDSAQLRIYAHKANAEPQLIRSIKGTGSGTQETAALITRSTLLALSESTATPAADSGNNTERTDTPRAAVAAAAATPLGDAVGGERVERTVAAVRGDHTAATQRVRSDKGERVEGDAGDPARVSVLAGWQGVVDGSGGAGQHGFALRGAVSFGLLELGLGLSASVPVTRRDALAELAIARHAALASVGLAAASGALRFSGGVHAGVALFQRSTTSRAQELAPERSSFTAGGLLGPWLGIAYMPGKLGVGMQLGLDILPGPPSFVYRHNDGEQLAHRPWALQPRAAIGIQGELR